MSKHLVIGGSGTLLPYYIGAIRSLEHNNITFKSITGTSGGAFIGSLLALGLSSYDIEKLLLSVVFKDFADYSLNPFYRVGLLNGDKILKFLKEKIPYKIGQTKIPLTIVTTNLSKEYTNDRVTYWNTYTTPNKELPQLIRASISIPMLFKYTLIDNNIHVDGGVSNNFATNIIPKDERKDIIGLKMDTTFAKQRKLDSNILFNLIDYLLTIIDTMMLSVEREHISTDIYNQIIKIPSSVSGVDFNLTETQIKIMIQEAYDFTEKYIKQNNLYI